MTDSLTADILGYPTDLMNEQRLKFRDSEKAPTVELGRQYPDPDEDELATITALLFITDDRLSGPETIFNRLVRPTLSGGHS
jgi:hypothetical protein